MVGSRFTSCRPWVFSKNYKLPEFPGAQTVVLLQAL